MYVIRATNIHKNLKFIFSVLSLGVPSFKNNFISYCVLEIVTVLVRFKSIV